MAAQVAIAASAAGAHCAWGIERRHARAAGGAGHRGFFFQAKRRNGRPHVPTALKRSAQARIRKPRRRRHAMKPDARDPTRGAGRSPRARPRNAATYNS